MKEISSVEVLLANRSFVYSSLGLAFGAEPTLALLDHMGSDHALQEVGLLGGDSAALGKACVGRARTLANPDDLVLLGNEYTRLFIGPDHLPAPPWESVYVTGKPQLFQETTLSVRTAYRAAGYLPKCFPRVADDHIALELNFMAAMAAQALEAGLACQEASAIDALARQRRFLDEHMLRWIPSFAETLCEQGFGESLYALLARFAAAYCAQDVAVIDELSAGLAVR